MSDQAARAKIEIGDIVRNNGSHNTYVITAELGNGKFIAANTIQLMNPSEWTIVKKAR